MLYSHLKYELFDPPTLFDKLFPQFMEKNEKKMLIDSYDLNTFYMRIQEKKLGSTAESRINYDRMVEETLAISPAYRKEKTSRKRKARKMMINQDDSFKRMPPVPSTYQ